MKFYFLFFYFLFSYCAIFSQNETQNNGSSKKIKIEHADPVYEDLTTELGAQKGENNLNLNFGYRKLRERHHSLLAQIEYEFVPIDHLGFEIVIPYTVYFNNELSMEPRPDNKLEFLQWATQFTFLTDVQRGISMAVGFRNIFEIESPEETVARPAIEAIIYFPFFTFAKNWEDQFFFLISGGPEITQDLDPEDLEASIELNTAVHYKLSKTNHFIGVELNKTIEDSALQMYIRPQISYEFTDNLTLGVAIGIPTGIKDDKWNGFLRISYEI